MSGQSRALANASETDRLFMTRNDLVGVYGRAGLTIAALTLVAGIIAAPVLPKFGAPAVVVSDLKDEPTFRLRITPASLKTNSA
jgi:hypothetical protein